MEQLIKDFFAANPEANECFTALGYVFATEEEATTKTGGTNVTPQRHTPVAETPAPEMVSHVVTEEDPAENKELAEQGVKVGDTIQIPNTNPQ